MLDPGKLEVIPDLRAHLLTRVLPFWAQHSLDPECGGFLTQLSREGGVIAASEKHLVMQTRMIYSFVTGCALGGPKQWLSAASQGVEFLLRHFRDVQYDGWFWSVTRAGRPAQSEKRMYGHAFVVYALAEYARATGDRRALAAAVHTCALIAHHLWDEEHGGVFEACDRGWTPTARHHTMGTHLHTLEAMLAMNEAMGEHRFWPRARQVADLIVNQMVESESKCGLEHFHADWTRDTSDPKRALINYGHNLEAAWLLLRVHRAEPNESYRETARGFLDYVMQYGLDTNYGGIYSHGPRNEAATRREKIWWVQCEALPAFLLGYLEFGEERYFDAFSQTLRFCLDYLHDPIFGEWYHSAEEDGAPRDQTKGSAWKAAYHVTQALAYADGYLREISA